MGVHIRRMTKGEFDTVYQWSVKNRAFELAEELHLSL